MEDVSGQTVETNYVPPKKTLYKVIYFVVSALLVIGFILFVWRVFTPEQKVTTPKETASVTSKELAAKAGYTITWSGDNSDTSGRSIIAGDERENSAVHLDSIGLNYPQQNPENPMLALGVFKEWEMIPNSTDVYLLLENPITKTIFKGRITFSRSSLNSITTPSGTRNDTTILMVDDLNYGPKTKDSTGDSIIIPRVDIYNFALFDKVIKAGDIVAVRNIVEYGSEKVRKDDNGVAVISKVIIRRFGGVQQFYNEI